MSKAVFLLVLWSCAVMGAMGKEIRPDSVAILYNIAAPDSKKLAETYSKARGIPEDNIIGLEMPVTADISREDYISKIQNPLRAEFDRNAWWSRAKDASGVLLPSANDIKVLVIMKGVPLRILAAPLPEGFKAPENDPIAGRNEASVDSELAMFGVEGVPAQGVLKNVYYQSDKPISEVRFPFLVLTARIDGASFETCERMIRDAVEAEKTGLWGKAYVDIANKFPQGDQWLSGVVTANLAAGIPTVVDRFNDTLPLNYPMTDAALYYGWYDANLSGPFLNPEFRFRKGAVALHIHSFSAEQLVDPMRNWSAGLLEKGAAVTVGNVFEPYLGLTNYFDILHKRLLEGHSWVEACWMSMPVASWQGVVLGDPLYRPFLHLDGSGEIVSADNDYRALRAAMLKWSGDSEERKKQLIRAAERLQSGVISEAIGLEAVEAGRGGEAEVWFGSAKKHYKDKADQLRQDFQIAATHRAADRKNVAVNLMKTIERDYAGTPGVSAAKAWLDILDPPPPPPATPKQ